MTSQEIAKAIEAEQEKRGLPVGTRGSKPLTPKEKARVLALLAAGKTWVEAARAMGVSKSMVARIVRGKREGKRG